MKISWKDMVVLFLFYLFKIMYFKYISIEIRFIEDAITLFFRFYGSFWPLAKNKRIKIKFLHRLRDHFGICSTAMNWFTSYLTDRKECVAIGHTVSEFHTLDCGVPHGSVFRPWVYFVCSSCRTYHTIARCSKQRKFKKASAHSIT